MPLVHTCHIEKAKQYYSRTLLDSALSDMMKPDKGELLAFLEGKPTEYRDHVLLSIPFYFGDHLCEIIWTTSHQYCIRVASVCATLDVKNFSPFVKTNFMQFGGNPDLFNQFVGDMTMWPRPTPIPAEVGFKPIELLVENAYLNYPHLKKFVSLVMAKSMLDIPFLETFHESLIATLSKEALSSKNRRVVINETLSEKCSYWMSIIQYKSDRTHRKSQIVQDLTLNIPCRFDKSEQTSPAQNLYGLTYNPFKAIFDYVNKELQNA